MQKQDSSSKSCFAGSNFRRIHHFLCPKLPNVLPDFVFLWFVFFPCKACWKIWRTVLIEIWLAELFVHVCALMPVMKEHKFVNSIIYKKANFRSLSFWKVRETVYRRQTAYLMHAAFCSISICTFLKRNIMLWNNHKPDFFALSSISVSMGESQIHWHG